VEELYAEFLRAPESVPADWRDHFEQLAQGDRFADLPRRGPSFRPSSLFAPPVDREHRRDDLAQEARVAALQDRVDRIVRAYRVRGHLIAKVDPLERPRPFPPELDPAYYGFVEADLDRQFSATTIHGPDVLTLRQILDRLKNTYCRSIGVQFMHIDDLEVKEWLQARMEGSENRIKLEAKEQLRILIQLTDAIVFEEFVQKKYLGAKTFSLEGAESLIPLLNLAVEKAAQHGIEQIVMGMAHRGRLNVLVNIMGKRPMLVFREFEQPDPEEQVGRGDVKYHLGYSVDFRTHHGPKVHLSLCFNPSHLEFVNPVVLGRTRAKQDRAGDGERKCGMALLIHGDAAFAGEGIVQEALNFSRLAGYATGGTLHIVVNNQIGFTTSPEEGRSTTYATDVAKMLQIPVFHVNGEDPEAVAQAIALAVDFRQEFQRDAVIDMYCYRRRGHNESDEPSFTQPLLYRAIEERESVRQGYLDNLLKLGEITPHEAEYIAKRRAHRLETQLRVARSDVPMSKLDPLQGVWQGYEGGLEQGVEDPETGVPEERLASLLETQTVMPEGFHPHPKLERWLGARRQMARGEKALDWAAAEALALADLAAGGFRIRLSGQDSARGTFTHRHAVLHDHETGDTYVPLQHLAEEQAPVEIINSPLSEAGVMGFEYGYSLDCPDGLILWEAQFGDFCNAAQVIIDQFLASAEEKWQRLSGLVLLLPHGYEGMGPEHSSARIERFLMLASEDNLQVVYPSTPAQYFHCLRRQAVRKWRKPLIVLTPKSMLRDPRATSSLADLATGRYERVMADPAGKTNSASRVLLCSGKVYYELLEERGQHGRDDAAILRLEQFYPFPDEELISHLAGFEDGTPVLWVQEEPANMGAWPFLRFRYCPKLYGRWPFCAVARPNASSPSTGSSNSHKLEQRELIEKAFTDPGLHCAE